MNQVLIWKLSMAVILLVLSLFDIKKKEIPLWGTGILLIPAVCAVVMAGKGNTNLIILLSGIAVGIFVIITAAVTNGKIGIGDGLVLCVLGLALGFIKTCILFLSALFLAAFFSGIMLLFKKCGLKSTVPFLPFLFISYLGVILL